MFSNKIKTSKFGLIFKMSHENYDFNTIRLNHLCRTYLQTFFNRFSGASYLIYILYSIDNKSIDCSLIILLYLIQINYFIVSSAI